MHIERLAEQLQRKTKMESAHKSGAHVESGSASSGPNGSGETAWTLVECAGAARALTWISYGNVVFVLGVVIYGLASIDVAALQSYVLLWPHVFWAGAAWAVVVVGPSGAPPYAATVGQLATLVAAGAGALLLDALFLFVEAALVSTCIDANGVPPVVPADPLDVYICGAEWPANVYAALAIAIVACLLALAGLIAVAIWLKRAAEDAMRRRRRALKQQQKLQKQQQQQQHHHHHTLHHHHHQHNNTPISLFRASDGARH